jgi:hypothetical protein
VVRYYQNALDSYRGQGCRTARWSSLEAMAMGRGTLVATASWELLREDGTTAIKWRQSYWLRTLEMPAKAFATAAHIE